MEIVIDQKWFSMYFPPATAISKQKNGENGAKAFIHGGHPKVMNHSSDRM